MWGVALLVNHIRVCASPIAAHLSRKHVGLVDHLGFTEAMVLPQMRPRHVIVGETYERVDSSFHHF